MAKRLLRYALSVSILTLFLLAGGFVIWVFLKDSQSSYQDILFYVGATPIALFSIGLFGDFIGRGTQSYQLSRSVSKQSANQRALNDAADNKNRLTSGTTWIIAGLFVWLVSYFIGF